MGKSTISMVIFNHSIAMLVYQVVSFFGWFYRPSGSCSPLLEPRSLVHVPLFISDGYHLVMTNIAMENPHAIKNGKPSISMGHLYHGYVK